jgi:Peptidase family M23
MIKRLVILLLFVGLCGYGYFKFKDHPLALKIDNKPPKMTVLTKLTAAGNQSKSVSVLLEDDRAGISSVKVLGSQANKEQEMFSKKFSSPTIKEVVKIPLDIKKLGFNEGKIKLKIQANDDSFWKNKTETSFEINLDYSAPQVAVLSLQHLVAQGGSESVVFSAKDNSPITAGVMVGEDFYGAIPASKVDPKFEKYPNIHISLFALPYEFSFEKYPVKVVAEDSAGNKSERAFKFRIKHYKQPEGSPNISKDFVMNKVIPLFDGYESRSANDYSVIKNDTSSDEGLIKIFRTINEDYRALLQKLIAEMQPNPISDPKFVKGFIKPISAATLSRFGELRSYYLDKAPAGHSTHDGLDLASVKTDKVMATNSGSVLYAGEFGIYGNTVVIDHGMGLSSLYGHLSTFDVQTGNTVSKGQVIGLSGETGLAGGDHLHFEYRVGNIPVTPIEWWDEGWVEDHFYGKLRYVLEQFQATETVQ